MYVFYDETGVVTFTAKGDHELVIGRSDWIEVPDQDFDNLFGWHVVDGGLTQMDLAPAKLIAVGRVNTIIGDIRSKFITVIPGQEGVYGSKEVEARDFLADADPDMANYPFLVNEIGDTAPDAYQLAQIWLYMAAAWRSVAAPLEGVRVRTINAVNAATTQGEIDGILAAISASLAATFG